jgi:hypothetical protein
LPSAEPRGLPRARTGCSSAKIKVRTVEGIEFEGNQFFRTAEERIRAISESRKRFALRDKYPALREGGWQDLEAGEVAPASEKTVVAFTRSLKGETLHCLFNLGHEKRDLEQIPRRKGNLRNRQRFHPARFFLRNYSIALSSSLADRRTL